MKVALVGYTGYIAEFILERFIHKFGEKSVLKIGRNGNADEYLDLKKCESFDYTVLDNVDYVIFSAAISGPDKCAEDFENCWNVNVKGTGYFIDKALQHGCRVIFFSSDAVFGEDSVNAYTEESPTRASTPYGKMKKAIEDKFKDNPDFKVVRLSYVASIKDRFTAYCLNCAAKGENAEIFHPFYRNAIVISDVVDVIIYLVTNWDDYEATFLNVAGEELVSRIRIVDELNRHLDGKLKYIVTMPKEDFFKNRPRITQMKSLYLYECGIISSGSFTEKMSKELEDLKL